MALRICDYCRKPFNSLGAGVCSECARMLDEAYVKARKYIYQNPQEAKFQLIVENTDISEKALSYLIDQGRILISDKSGSGLKCKVCGKETADGSLCSQCKEKLFAEKLFSDTNRTENDKKKNRSEIIPLTHK